MKEVLKAEVEYGGSTGGGRRKESDHGLEADLFGCLALTTEVAKVVAVGSHAIDVGGIDAHQIEDFLDRFLGCCFGGGGDE